MIEEVIKDLIKTAEEEEQLSKTGKWFEGDDWNIKARQACVETALYYRQIATWLEELKQLRIENEQLKKTLHEITSYALEEHGRVLSFIFPNAGNPCKENVEDIDT